MNPKEYPVSLIVTLFIGIVLIYFSPSDSQLGQVIKLIYLHGALIFTGLFLFAVLGFVSIASIFRNSLKDLLLDIERTAIVFWLSAAIVGNIASELAWGGIYWNEPRLKVVIIISLISLSVYFLSTASGNDKIKSVLGIALSSLVFLLILGAGKIMHPVNPFGASDSSIRFFFGIITLVFLIISIQMVHWLSEKRKET
ncbi:MAG: hypothetical protein O8C64_03315 [Candidatus Methanoperedens sp.]|nr:hypothetical protein [Candidatus Methanoperedens sp.]